MNVEVRLYGALRRFRPAGAPGPAHTPIQISLSAAATVDDLCRRVGIPHGVGHAPGGNGGAVETDHALADGDRVSLFPPSAGG